MRKERSCVLLVACVLTQGKERDDEHDRFKGDESPCAGRWQIAQSHRGEARKAIAAHIGNKEPERWPGHRCFEGAGGTQYRSAKADPAEDTANFKTAVGAADVNAKAGGQNIRIEQGVGPEQCEDERRDA